MTRRIRLNAADFLVPVLVVARRSEGCTDQSEGIGVPRTIVGASPGTHRLARGGCHSIAPINRSARASCWRMAVWNTGARVFVALEYRCLETPPVDDSAPTCNYFFRAAARYLESSKAVFQEAQP
jgi:hypothetical protein